MATATKPKKIDLSDVRLRTLHREVTFKRDAVNAEKRTMDMAFASENPVERYFGKEVLACNAASCVSRSNPWGDLLLELAHSGCF